MRVMIKGGIWKNTEDEVLKAAIMKYGLNQWARISSLLVRKSAKQCKSRWYEWLDPSIKKIEWSREEDEKLLHCAKILPNQWRSIGPIVGRTPAQCLERYEQLLTQAQEKTGDYDPATDPKNLRAKDFDPHPESHPAIPDPTDMDQDEKEMLSEARARLANTKGKKAKRKAREKQLQEARRLASLQKRRELRMAGIGLGKRKRRKHWIDYNREIPFQKKAPRGLYDTTKDDRRAKAITSDARQNFTRQFIRDIEGERRDDIEKKEREKDVKRTKLWRKKNLAEVIEAEQRLTEAEMISQRPTLSLPEAQVTDQDIEDLAKFNAQRGEAEDDDAVTQQLIDGNAVATPTTKVEIRTPSNQADIHNEARFALELRDSQTPLHGGENPEFTPGVKTFQKKTHQVRTPNTLIGTQAIVRADGSTPGTAIGTPGSMMGTPSSMGTPGMMGTPGTIGGRTPGRDSLAINTPGGVSTKQSKRHRKRKRKEMKDAFDLLPQPHNEYTISRPEIIPEDPSNLVVPDAVDVELQRKEDLRKKEVAEFKRRTQVIQRGLSRSRKIGQLRVFPDDKNRFLADAANAIHQEMILLMQHDNEAYPINGGRPPKRRKYTRREYDDESLSAANKLIEDEIENVKKEDDVEWKMDDFKAFSIQSNKECIYVPQKEKFDFLKNCTMKERLNARKQEFALTREQLIHKMSRSRKLEKKIDIKIGGYVKIVDRCKNSLKNGFKEYVSTDREVEVFTNLEESERRAMPLRLHGWKELVDIEKDREREVQSQYKYLLQEMAFLTNLLK